MARDEDAAVLEGEREIVLTPETTLPMRLEGLELALRPQGFFQTNTLVAAALYAQARAWVTAYGESGKRSAEVAQLKERNTALKRRAAELRRPGTLELEARRDCGG